MAGPTRAEAVRDLIQVLKADYTRALVARQHACPECKGEGVIEGPRSAPPLNSFGDDEPREDRDSDHMISCPTCEGKGYVVLEEFVASEVPEDLRPFVTGFKTGGTGRILPEMRSKDKAAAELIKAIGNGWGSEFPRDAFGGDAPAEPAQQQLVSKESIIAHYERIALSGDPTVAMAALREISKLRGYLTEDDENIDKNALTLQDVGSFFGKLLNANGRLTADQNVAAKAAEEAGEFETEEEILPE